MQWFSTEELANGVTRLTEPYVDVFYRANFYRIAGRDLDIHLDFGMGILRLPPHSMPGGKPVLAIATHAHVDHIGGFHEYGNRAGHRLEAKTFAELDDDGTVQTWFRRQTAPVEHPPFPGWSIEDYALRSAPLNRHLEEGDVIDLGDRKFTILHLPGHSPGCIALFDEFNGEFFSGDAIYDDELVDDVPTSDIGRYLETMQRLRHLDISVGHGGHGPSYDTSRMHAIAAGYIQSKQD